MRLIMLMGKGGVGKTTCAAATALMASEYGSRVLVVSTDAAHSLADALDIGLGCEPTRVTDRLDAVQLDGRYELERSWSAIADYAQQLLGVAELGRMHAQELLVIPGLDQLLALARLRSLMVEGAWDAVVVDCAPSADSLRLLSLPEVLDWYLERLFGRDGSLRSRLRRTLERTLAVAAPSDRVLTSISELSQSLSDLRQTLRECDLTARLVLTPERLATLEARRTLTYLALYNYPTDAIIVNRVLEADEGASTLAAWHANQQRQLHHIAEAFNPLPMLLCRFRASEPLGLVELQAIGQELFGDTDPLRKLSNGEAISIRADADRAIVRIPVGGLEAESVSLHRLGDELILSMGEYRRAVALPDGLRRHQVVRAGVRERTLEVELAETVDA